MTADGQRAHRLRADDIVELALDEFHYRESASKSPASFECKQEPLASLRETAVTSYCEGYEGIISHACSTRGDIHATIGQVLYGRAKSRASTAK